MSVIFQKEIGNVENNEEYPSFERYRKSVGIFPKLTKTQEQKLFRILFYSRNAKNVERARKELINGNLLLVISRAFRCRLRYPEVDIMDLIAVGNIALMKAVNKYRAFHKSKAKFGTFALPIIDHEILKYIEESPIIKIPWEFLKNYKGLKELKEKYNGKLTDEMIMRKLKINKDTLRCLRENQNKPVVYLEDTHKKTDDDEESTWEDKIEDENIKSPIKILLSHDLREYLRGLTSKLSPKEQYIICKRYLSVDCHNGTEIGKEMDLSKERVRQLTFVALRKLRRLLVNDNNLDLIKQNTKKEWKLI